MIDKGLGKIIKELHLKTETKHGRIIHNIFISTSENIPPVECGRLQVAAYSALCGSQSELHRDRSDQHTEKHRYVYAPSYISLYY